MMVTFLGIGCHACSASAQMNYCGHRDRFDRRSLVPAMRRLDLAMSAWRR
jgi:hypothetical protein